jgi:hypothetical protein
LARCGGIVSEGTGSITCLSVISLLISGYGLIRHRPLNIHLLCASHHALRGHLHRCPLIWGALPPYYYHCSAICDALRVGCWLVHHWGNSCLFSLLLPRFPLLLHLLHLPACWRSILVHLATSIPSTFAHIWCSNQWY